MEAEARDPLFNAAVGVAVVGFAMALFGVYWDDAWHTDRGRDELLSPPHLSLYAGVAVVVGVVILWAVQRRGRHASAGPVGLGVAGAAFTLASAPVDEWWHQSFGRDAVLWSPPHLAALAGTIALGTSVALVASGRVGPRSPAPGVAAGAGVIGAWQVLVMEYDTDVPQFSPVWYLPVMAVGLCAAALTIQASFPQRVRWPATRAGAAYTLAMIGVALGLGSAGFSTPIVPLVIPTLAVADLAHRSHWDISRRVAGFVGALFVTNWIYLGLVPGGVQPSLSQAVAGSVLAVAGVAAVVAALDPTVRIALHRGSIAALVVIGIGPATSLVGLPAADAHDPGQGDQLVDVVLVAQVTDRTITVEAVVERDETTAEPIGVVARRAGRTLTGPLTPTSNGWAGQIDVDEDGRWFVYVEARRGQQTVEAWIPVIAGATGTTSKHTALYVSTADSGLSAAQLMAGVVLLSLVAALLARVAMVVRTTLGLPAPVRDVA